MPIRKIISFLLAILLIITTGILLWNIKNNDPKQIQAETFASNYTTFLKEKNKYNNTMEIFQNKFATVQKTGNFTTEEVEELKRSLEKLKTNSQTVITAANTIKTESCSQMEQLAKAACNTNFETYIELLVFSNNFLDFTIKTSEKGDTISSQVVQANINKKVQQLQEKSELYEKANTVFHELIPGLPKSLSE